MITLQNITLRRGPNVLLDNLNWTIFPKQHIGIIGENGTGKSSLFAMLLGQLQADKGNLELPNKLRIAHVAQETPAYSESALDYVLDGDVELRALEIDLKTAEANNDGSQIALIHDQLSKINAYTAPSRAAQLLDGLGFNHSEQQKPVSAFSGGWRVRLNIAKALMCPSDVLLLDEPTNHLDLDAVLWLEQWLVNYPGTLLLISHDRDFLDHVVDHIAYLAKQQLKLYNGNYSAFEKQHAAELLIQQSSYEKQQKQIAHMQDFVNRFRAQATKAKQAQSRLKALERMDVLTAVHSDSPLQFKFKEPDECPNPLLKLENASLSYGDKLVLENITLSIAPKDRIALLGPNGAGKSSLIKMLAGEVTPTSGIRELSRGVRVGYFAQHQIDHLQLDETPFQHMRQIAPKEQDVNLRSFLGGFGFVGDRVLEPVRNFSGGEKSRLALALLVWQKPNLLLMDEPTNHLDLEMRNTLSMALQEYQGAMIIVSHDRFLVRTTVDQLSLVAHHHVEDFKGDLSDYEKWLLEYRRPIDVTANKDTQSKKAERQINAKDREARRPLVQQIKKLEESLQKLQKETLDIQTTLSDPALYDDENKLELKKLLRREVEVSQQIQSIELEWLEAYEKLEEFK